MSAYYTEIPVIAFDGIYGTATAEAVRAYQRLFGLAVDGVVGPATWNSIYNQFLHAAQRGRPGEPLPCVCIPGL